MTIRKRIGPVALGLAAVALMGGFPIAAQEPANSKPSAPPAAKKQERPHPVPKYFGQIALTTEQRASIQGIQAKRLEKIEALEKQIEAEKAGMLADCEGVLNETQKKLLETLRKAAAEHSTRSAKPAGTGKPSN